MVFIRLSYSSVDTKWIQFQIWPGHNPFSTSTAINALLVSHLGCRTIWDLNIFLGYSHLFKNSSRLINLLMLPRALHPIFFSFFLQHSASFSWPCLCPVLSEVQTSTIWCAASTGWHSQSATRQLLRTFLTLLSKPCTDGFGYTACGTQKVKYSLILWGNTPWLLKSPSHSSLACFKSQTQILKPYSQAPRFGQNFSCLWKPGPVVPIACKPPCSKLIHLDSQNYWRN